MGGTGGGAPQGGPVSCPRSPRARPSGRGDGPGWGAGGVWQPASVSNPRWADNDPLICTAQAGVAEPQRGQVSAKVTLSGPQHTLGENMVSRPHPVPQAGSILLDCQRPRPGHDSRAETWPLAAGWGTRSGWVANSGERALGVASAWAELGGVTQWGCRDPVSTPGVGVGCWKGTGRGGTGTRGDTLVLNLFYFPESICHSLKLYIHLFVYAFCCLWPLQTISSVITRLGLPWSVWNPSTPQWSQPPGDGH